MKVFISNIVVKQDRHVLDYEYFYIFGQLQSGLEIWITDYSFDLRKYVGQHLDMLLSVMRNPYLEHRLEIKSNFLSWDHYSIEIVDEVKADLTKKYGPLSREKGNELILTGEYIDPYIIPKDWGALIKDKASQVMYRSPSALRTKERIFLLSPFHLRKPAPNIKIPKTITIGTGLISLVAWRHKLMN
ncbi:hypothetical protein LCGC14_0563700 [marine sediment metagenome]|uniref:Uncharacterized protein n=1 Tax=marine sediment metagenome TaxID=412755 RepID=A0A0F9RRJ9_9ZZZZ|nr:MAG: hypothetical protein Lokiarch_04450 [Candidatus Lokiarchaeum sp. GC14_75]